MVKILIGCDPEIFVTKDDKFVSAHDLCPGDKKNPFEVPNGSVQVDGMALEIGITPAETADEFVKRIAMVRGSLRTLIDPEYELVVTPTAHFEPAYFKKVPSYAKALGCDPDYNAYTEEPNPRPKGDRPIRTGAGHIHIGWTTGESQFNTEHWDLCVAMAKQMDYYVGVNSLLWDKDSERRSMYGKAGAFRVKPYGMEYRTPSNAWLSTELLQRWVFHATHKAATDLLNNVACPADHLGKLAQFIIDTNDYDWPTSNEIDVGLPKPPVVKAA